MVHRIQSVEVQPDFRIRALFFNGVLREYDVKPLFQAFPAFSMLRETPQLFGEVKVDAGGCGISWNDDLDLDAETIWEHGLVIEVETKRDLNHLVAYRLAAAREKAGITQRELAEKTGIYQADISKIERAIGNPSLSTLKRLAEGLGMELSVDFVSADTR